MTYSEDMDFNVGQIMTQALSASIFLQRADRSDGTEKWPTVEIWCRSKQPRGYKHVLVQVALVRTEIGPYWDWKDAEDGVSMNAGPREAGEGLSTNFEMFVAGTDTDHPVHRRKVLCRKCPGHVEQAITERTLAEKYMKAVLAGDSYFEL